MDFWKNGYLEKWIFGKMELWKSGILENSTLEKWNLFGKWKKIINYRFAALFQNIKLGKWNFGKMELCKNGILEKWNKNSKMYEKTF